MTKLLLLLSTLHISTNKYVKEKQLIGPTAHRSKVHWFVSGQDVSMIFNLMSRYSLVSIQDKILVNLWYASLSPITFKC